MMRTTKFLALSIICGLATTAVHAATCTDTKVIQRKWTVSVTGNNPSASASFENMTVTSGSKFTSETFTTKLVHKAPKAICDGPTPALPTTISLNANISWQGGLLFTSTASEAVAELSLSIPDGPVSIPDQTMTDATTATRTFSVFRSHTFSTGVNSTFTITGTMDIASFKDPSEQADVNQTLSITVNPRSRTGYVAYTVPAVPLPAGISLGLTGLAAIAGLGAVRRAGIRSKKQSAQSS